jgi:hypothetical protein
MGFGGGIPSETKKPVTPHLRLNKLFKSVLGAEFFQDDFGHYYVKVPGNDFQTLPRFLSTMTPDAEKGILSNPGMVDFIKVALYNTIMDGTSEARLAKILFPIFQSGDKRDDDDIDF